MEKCLVTKLNAVVNDESLPYIGKIRVRIKANSGDVAIIIGVPWNEPDVDTPLTYTLVGGGDGKEVGIYHSGTYKGKTFTRKTDQITVNVGDKDAILFIDSPELRRIGLSGTANYVCELIDKDFRYIPKLREISLSYLTGSVIDLSKIIPNNKDLLKIFHMVALGSVKNGDVSCIRDCININDLTLNYSKMYGSLDDIFDNWAEKGKVGNLSLFVQGGTFILNGQKINKYKGTIVFADGNWSAS